MEFQVLSATPSGPSIPDWVSSPPSHLSFLVSVHDCKKDPVFVPGEPGLMVALRVYGVIEPLNVAMPLLKVFSFAAGVAATSSIPTSDSAGLRAPKQPSPN